VYHSLHCVVSQIASALLHRTPPTDQHRILPARASIGITTMVTSLARSPLPT
jgi:hypothetical protein